MNAVEPLRTGAPRLLIEARLRPVQGERFQPTGFPDLGPATFELADRTEMLLVESTQSIANRLEEVGWSRADRAPVKVLEGLPYVRVEDAEGAFLTSSRLEAHRLASAYVREATFQGRAMTELMRERLGLRKDVPLDHRLLARAIFSLDPLSLVHGVFFAIRSWPQQPKVARMVSGFVEARGVLPADNGGVKRDDVLHTVRKGQGAEEGYGWVPYHRREFTAREIIAYFNVDLVQLRSYGLGQEAQDLLLTLSLWEIGKLLEGELRFRSACDLDVLSLRVTRPDGFEMPAAVELEAELPALVEGCRDLYQEPRLLAVSWARAAEKVSEAVS